MKRFAILLSCAVSIFAQRPTNPALLIPQEAPLLDYVAVAESAPGSRRGVKWEHRQM